MNVYENSLECYGCSACRNICPLNAIDVIADTEGFLYPVINEEKCINCNLCRKVCPIDKEIGIVSHEKNIEQKVYAAKHRDLEVVLSSSSGGVFTALSKYILDNEGAVYGASFDSSFRLIHKRVIDKDSQNDLKGSKYVQSDINDIYYMIENDLKTGIYVLFSGTPCQNHGLISYLDLRKVNRASLFTCDFICHGTSSPRIWEDYISFLESKYEDIIEKFSFRSKKNGWRNFSVELKLANKSTEKSFEKKYSYLNLYNSRLITRPSCFRCKYTSYERVSDITLADYWNIQHVMPDFNDNNGVSMVMVNSKKGKELFENIADTIDFRISNQKDAWQPHLEYPVKSPKSREKFWNDYKQRGFSFVMNNYGHGTFVSRMIKFLTPAIKKIGLYTFAGKMYNKILGR